MRVPEFLPKFLPEFLIGTVAALAIAATTPARAALDVGAKAPDFTLQATLGGHEFQASLAAMLGQGPVVLYFYPAAFTSGCTVEAHDFAEAVPQFQALGAKVLGVSEDKIDKLDKFSVSACQSKFAVAADANGQVAHAYQAVMPIFTGYANRTSYAIAPDGTVIGVYSALNPDQHVARMLAALTSYRAAHPQSGSQGH